MKTNYKHLNCEERTLIQLSLERDCTMRAIALSLDRSAISISRKPERYGWCDPRFQSARAGRPALSGVYRAVIAHQHAAFNRSRDHKPARLAADGFRWSQIQKLLRQRYSPEQIACIIPRMIPYDSSLHASPETVYTALSAMPRVELRTARLATLGQGRKVCRSRASGEVRLGEIPKILSINQRPPEVDECVIPGHWGGDLVKGKGNASAVGTVVERTSLFVNLAKVTYIRAQAAVEGFSMVLNLIDAQLRLSMTYGLGHETSHHEQFSERTGVKVYF